MSYIDYAIILIISLSCLISIIRGFASEVISLTTWICAFFITSKYWIYLSASFIELKNELIRSGVAIITIFITILIIGSVINYIISNFLKRTNLSKPDILLGISFGIIRGILIFTFVIFLIDTFTKFQKKEYWQNSYFIPKLNFVFTWLLDYLQKQ